MNRVKDNAGLLSSSDINELVSKSWNFDANIIISNFPSKGDLENTVHNMVDGPNVIAIGLDPSHHSTVVCFGDQTGVPPSEYDGIAAAGNSFFKNSNWVAGLETIGYRTMSLVHTNAVHHKTSMTTSTTTTTLAQPVVITHQDTGHPVLSIVTENPAL